MSSYIQAIEFAELGFQVFPLNKNLKTPAFSGWQKSATSDLSLIKYWLGDGGNYGIPTGMGNNLVVIDYDAYQDKQDLLADLQSKYGLLPKTLTVKTRAGGIHKYFTYPSNYIIKNSAGSIAPHVDIRGDGGYVVGPGSYVGADKKGEGGFYEIIDDSDIAQLPDTWAQLLSQSKQSSGDLSREIANGSRNSTLLSIAGKMRHQEIHQDLIDQALLSINDSSCKPPLPVSEVLSVANRYANKEQLVREKTGFQLVHISSLQPKPISFTVDGYIEENSISEIHGDPGTGKSLIAQEAAVCVAAGINFVDRTTKQGAVIYIAGEGLNGITRRFSALCEKHLLDRESLPLYVSRGSSSLTDITQAHEVQQAILSITNGIKPILIVIDTVARNFGAGDENSTRDMSAFIEHIDLFLREPFGASVLLVHHSGHGEKHRARGSSALKAAVDAEYLVTKDDLGTIRMQCHKAKDFDPPMPMAFNIASTPIQGHETPFLQSCTYSPQTKTNGLGAQQKTLLDCLKALISENKEVEISDLKNSCTNVGMKDRSYNDALKGLIKRGLIYQRDNWVHIKPPKEWPLFGPSTKDETLRNVVS